MRGSRALAVKAFGRVGDYANRKLSGVAIKAAIKSNVSDAVNHASLRGRHTDAITDPVRGIEQVTATVESSNDKIARTIEDINTELQKFLYKRKTTVKRRAGAEEDETKVDPKKKPVKPKIKPKPKVKPRAKYKPKSKFRPKPKNPLTKLKGKVPNNAVTKLGSGASTALSGASKLKGVAKAGKFGKALGVAGTAIGMAGEYAGEIADTGNHQRAAAAAAGTGAGMTIGGWAGGAAGAALGLAVGGPVGAAIGGVIGYMGGSWGGGEVGAAGGRHAYDIAANNKARVGGAFNEHSVDLTDLEYNFSNIHFESRELVFEFAKITGANNLGSQSNGGRHTGLGPDADYSGGPNGDRGGVLFESIGRQGVSPNSVVPSNPRNANHTPSNRSSAGSGSGRSGDSYSSQKIENVDTNDKIGSMVNQPGQPVQTRRGEAGEFNYGLTKEGTEELGDPKQQRFDQAGKLVNIKTASGKTVQVHEKVADRAQGFLNELEARGYKITEIGGYSHRPNVNNPSQMSTHAYGTTLDINPGANPNKGGRTDFPAGTEQLAWKYGFSWGGRFNDSMHFESMSPAARESKLKQMVEKGTITAEEADHIRKTGLPSNVVKEAKNKATEQDVVKSHNEILASPQNPLLGARTKQQPVPANDAIPVPKPEVPEVKVNDATPVPKQTSSASPSLRKPITEQEIIEALRPQATPIQPPVPLSAESINPTEPPRQAVDDQNVTGPSRTPRNIHEKQSSLRGDIELNDRNDNKGYQTFTEYQALSKVV